MNKPRKRQVKTLNSQILTQTQMAIEAIKEKDRKSSSNMFPLHNPINILAQLDQDYSRLTIHKQLKIDKKISLQLFPYTQQYYYLDMMEYVFPMRIILKDVRSKGIIFVGYNKEYPGLEQKRKQFSQQQQQYPEKNYDYKTNINKDMMITLKNLQNKPINKVYMGLVAEKQLFMLNLKIEFLGQIKPSDELSIYKTTGNKLFSRGETGQNFKLSEKKIKSQKKLPSTRNHHETYYPNNSREGHIANPFSKINCKMSQQQFQILPTLNSKHLTKTELLKESYYGKSSALSKTLRFKIPQTVDQKLNVAKVNRQTVELVRIREHQIKQIAAKFKNLIQNYQKNYREDLVRKKKINRLLLPALFTINFMHIANHQYRERFNKLEMSFQINHLVKRFTNLLFRNYRLSCKQIPYKSYRCLMGIYSVTQLMGHTMHPNSIKRSGQVITNVFNCLMVALTVNHSLNSATKYRSKIRLIQKYWLTQFRSRLLMLNMLCQVHVRKMGKQHPNLMMFVQTFENKNIANRICYEYLADQSYKYHKIYKIYQMRLKEIQQIIQTNKQIETTNKINQKKKDLLVIPKMPVKPGSRIFRDTDILKSMIRAWFELQYKKWLKVNLKTK